MFNVECRSLSVLFLNANRAKITLPTWCPPPECLPPSASIIHATNAQTLRTHKSAHSVLSSSSNNMPSFLQCLLKKTHAHTFPTATTIATTTASALRHCGEHAIICVFCGRTTIFSPCAQTTSSTSDHDRVLYKTGIFLCAG